MENRPGGTQGRLIHGVHHATSRRTQVFFNQYMLRVSDGRRCRIPRSFKLYAADFILTCAVSLRYDGDEPLHTGMVVTDVAECTWCTNWQGEVHCLRGVEWEACHTGVWA